MILNNLSFDLHNSFQFDSNRFFISSFLTFLFLPSTKYNVNSHFSLLMLFHLYVDVAFDFLEENKIEKSMWFHAISPLNLIFFKPKENREGEFEKKREQSKHPSHAKISSSFLVTLCFVASSFCIVINKGLPSISRLILLQSQDED